MGNSVLQFTQRLREMNLGPGDTSPEAWGHLMGFIPESDWHFLTTIYPELHPSRGEEAQLAEKHFWEGKEPFTKRGLRKRANALLNLQYPGGDDPTPLSDKYKIRKSEGYKKKVTKGIIIK